MIMGSACSHKPTKEGWTTLCGDSLPTCFAQCKAVCFAIPQHTSTDLLSCLLHQKLSWRGALCAPLGRCRRQRSLCAKDVERCIRYNAYRLLQPLLRAAVRRSIVSTVVL